MSSEKVPLGDNLWTDCKDPLTTRIIRTIYFSASTKLAAALPIRLHLVLAA